MYANIFANKVQHLFHSRLISEAEHSVATPSFHDIYETLVTRHPRMSPTKDE